MTKTLEDTVTMGYIKSYKTAPLIFKDKIVHKIAQDHVARCNGKWSSYLPMIVKKIRDHRVTCALEMDWYEYFGSHISPDMIRTALIIVDQN